MQKKKSAYWSHLGRDGIPSCQRRCHAAGFFATMVVANIQTIFKIMENGILTTEGKIIVSKYLAISKIVFLAKYNQGTSKDSKLFFMAKF